MKKNKAKRSKNKFCHEENKTKRSKNRSWSKIYIFFSFRVKFKHAKSMMRRFANYQGEDNKTE
jgi:hypothetical protein